MFRSGAAFNAQREQEDGEFVMRIGFVPLNGTNPPEYASNVPAYTYLFTTGSISIVCKLPIVCLVGHNAFNYHFFPCS